MRKSACVWMGTACLVMLLTGCDIRTSSDAEPDTVTQVVHDTVMVPVDSSDRADVIRTPVTLPLLDAFLIDTAFVNDTRTRIQLNDAEIDTLRSIARSETSRLRDKYSGDYTGSTSEASALAEERVGAAIGADRTRQLFALVRERWGGTSTMQLDSSYAAMGDSGETGGASAPSGRRRSNAVPNDTRIVINLPAYRMDLFKDGQLLRSYTVGIGYPEFPAPTGLRSASRIIFNPTWTPPDEPWVEPSRVGKTVGAARNPLGIAKVPIGLPSLIHAGKSQSMLGTFSSHGCVGLTDEQMREFSKQLAEMGGATVTDSMIAAFAKHPKETRTIELPNPVPVELRYETIVAQDGELHIYRDVYGYDTNTEPALQRTLATYDLALDQLSADERTKIDSALSRMSLDPSRRRDTSSFASTGTADPGKAAPGNQRKQSEVTTRVSGAKEMTVEVAALEGKGYPAPVEKAKKIATPTPVDRRPSPRSLPAPFVMT